MPPSEASAFSIRPQAPASREPQATPAQSPRQTVVVVILATLLLLVANGRHPIPVAAWLAPLFLLRFIRLQKPARGLLVAWLVLSATWSFQFRGMAPLPPVFYFLLAAVYGLVCLAPFAADKLLARHVTGFGSTLVLPSAWVVTEFLVAEFTPYGSWGSAAYSQYENLVLLQIAAVTGLYGISFLIAWFASVANQAWERGFEFSRVKGASIGFAAVMAAVLVFGGARLTLFPPDAPTVRVASVTRPDIELFPSPEVAQRAFAGTASAEELGAIRRRGAAINEDLFRLSAREAAAGAKIVLWGETNAFALKEDEPELIRRGAELARTHGIYLGLAAGVWNTAATKPLENKVVLIDPQGNTVWDFWKARPVPGGEAAISAVDDGKIKSAPTPFGRLGAAICFDMDFPGLLQEAGRQHVDILLVPSNDWKAIDPWHSHMARLRAVEQGFNIVRHVSGGLSLAADYQGRVLASMDHYTAADRVMIAQVPTRGVQTVYAIVGDAFAWLCVLNCFAFGVVAWRRPAVSGGPAQGVCNPPNKT